MTLKALRKSLKLAPMRESGDDRKRFNPIGNRSSMKIIFLDIDGVLNNTHTKNPRKFP